MLETCTLGGPRIRKTGPRLCKITEHLFQGFLSGMIIEGFFLHEGRVIAIN